MQPFFHAKGQKIPFSEGALDHVDAIGIYLRHVEADAHLATQPHHIKARDVAVTALFVPLHRLRTRAETIVQARLDLAEDERLPHLHDEVRLAERGLVVAREDLPAPLFQLSRRGAFSPFAQNFVVKVLRCISHSPNSPIASVCSLVP